MVSPLSSFRQAFPPERLPSRRTASNGKTRPKVPSHRAPSSRTVGFGSPRVSQIQLQKFPSVSSEQPQVGRGDQRCSGTDALSLGEEEEEEGGTSPLPKQPRYGRDISPGSQRKRPTRGAEQFGREFSSSCHFYRTIHNADVNTPPVQLVGYSIYNTVTVMAIVDVKPCQWRLDVDPFLDTVELHIRQIDVNTYPMRRLLRLIHKRVPFGRGGTVKSGALDSQPLTGSLAIHQKDNKHLQFIHGVPTIIPLLGSTVLADVVDVSRLPSEGANVHLRWKEDPVGGGLKEGTDLSVSIDPWQGGNGSGNTGNDAPEVSLRGQQQQYASSGQKSRGGRARSYASNTGTCVGASRKGNASDLSSMLPGETPPHGSALPLSTNAKERCRNLSQNSVDGGDQSTSLITYLHTPAIMYHVC